MTAAGSKQGSSIVRHNHNLQPCSSTAAQNIVRRCQVWSTVGDKANVKNQVILCREAWSTYLENGLPQLYVIVIRGFAIRYQQVGICLHAESESQHPQQCQSASSLHAMLHSALFISDFVQRVCSLERLQACTWYCSIGGRGGSNAEVVTVPVTPLTTLMAVLEVGS